MISSFTGQLNDGFDGEDISRKSACNDTAHLSISRPGRECNRRDDQQARKSSSSTFEELRESPAQASSSSCQGRQRVASEWDGSERRARVAQAFSEQSMTRRPRSGGLPHLDISTEASHAHEASSHERPVHSKTKRIFYV